MFSESKFVQKNEYKVELKSEYRVKNKVDNILVFSVED